MLGERLCFPRPLYPWTACRRSVASGGSAERVTCAPWKSGGTSSGVRQCR